MSFTGIFSLNSFNGVDVTAGKAIELDPSAKDKGIDVISNDITKAAVMTRWNVFTLVMDGTILP